MDGLRWGIALAKSLLYVVLAILVIPAMLYGYSRAQPNGCEIDGQIFAYAYALDTPVLAPGDEPPPPPTHAGLIVREGERFRVDSEIGYVEVQVLADGRRELKPAPGGDGCEIAGDVTTSTHWLWGEKVWTEDGADPPGAWRYSIEGISPVAEQIGRNLWPFVGFALIAGIITMAVRTAVR